MLWWLIWIAAGLAGLILLICLVGALLPRDHEAAAEAVMPAPPARVAAMVGAVEAYPEWRGGVKRVEMLGRDGEAVRFIEHGKDGILAFRLTEEASGTRFRSTIDDPKLPFGGSWIIALAPAGEGTLVRIEEHGFVRNVLFRFVSALILGHDRTMKAWLADMARGLGG
ncbi:MAG TPA: SRPBCC family protein [Allosphingosinicella sp.]|nr:SRPBCC family protein [Allosphingosinicella sp.]